MTTSLSLIGLLAATFATGCAHECRCVCVEGANRTVASPVRGTHSGSFRVADLRRSRRERLSMYASPFTQPPPKPWTYPDPFDPDPSELPLSDERMQAAGKHFDAAVALEEAEEVAAERARAEHAQEEAQAAAFANELREHFQQITRP